MINARHWAHSASAALVALLAILMIRDVPAQEYPSRPLRLVVIFAIGSTADVHGRFVAQKLAEQLGQQVIVENNAGAGGIIAMRGVIRAQPLGYTLLYTTNGLVGNLYAFKDPQYRLEDYTLVGPGGLSPYGMMLSTAVPARTVAEFVAHARANPGKLNFGSSGPTAGSNILVERLKAAAGIDLVMVPFKGGEPATAALVSGDIQVFFSTVGAVRTRSKMPQIRALAVTSEQRAAILPSVPTFKESGYPSMILTVWNAVLVPSAAPKPVIQKLQDALARANATEDMKRQLERMEFEPWTGTLDQFMTYIKAEGVAIADDIRRLKIPLQD